MARPPITSANLPLHCASSSKVAHVHLQNVVSGETCQTSSKEGKVADSNGSHSSPPEDDEDEAQGDGPSQDGGSGSYSALQDLIAELLI